jgi:hypothetical protein
LPQNFKLHSTFGCKTIRTERFAGHKQGRRIFDFVGMRSFVKLLHCPMKRIHAHILLEELMADSSNQQLNPASYQLLNEYGVTGLQQYSGLIHEEWLPALRGKHGVKIYTEMKDNDPIVGAMLSAVKMMMRQAEWRVDPASGKPIDKEAADFLESCMHDMEASWTDTLSEIFSFLVYGWSLHEMLFKKRNGDSRDPAKKSKYNDGLIGWRDLPIRSQESFLRWEYDSDNRELLGMTQLMYGQAYTIPLGKALLFRAEVNKHNPEGRSILRNAWKPYYFKKRLEEVEAIGAERDLAGLPMITPPEGLNIWDTSDPQAAQQLQLAMNIVQNVRRDSQEGIVKPHGWEFELLSTGGQRSFNVEEIIHRLDTRILMTSLADFLVLGHGPNGNYELHRDKVSNFGSVVDTYLDMVAGVFNTVAVPLLMRVNPRFVNLEEFSTIAHSAVETPDLHDFAEFIQYAVGSGTIVPDPNLENHVRRMAELPERVEDAPDDTQAPAKKPQSVKPAPGEKVPASEDSPMEDAGEEAQAEKLRKGRERALAGWAEWARAHG